MSIADDLLDKKDRIEKAKAKESELKGQKTTLMERLKKDFKLASLEEAKRRLKTMARQKEKLQEDLDKGVKELEKAYEW